ALAAQKKTTGQGKYHTFNLHSNDIIEKYSSSAFGKFRCVWKYIDPVGRSYNK
ncbi:unnamed protein product, partial [Rotaria magnacalcarata]